MPRLDIDQWRKLFRAISREAFHLELRDSYGVASEQERFSRWLAGERESYEKVAAASAGWTDMVTTHTAAGRAVRRLRVITEPISDYIHFEWAGTGPNVDAGEDVRWLPRHRLPPDVEFPGGGNDFWLLDEQQVLFGHFDDEGRSLGKELVTDPAVVAECVKVRDALWPLGIPHAGYSPTLE